MSTATLNRSEILGNGEAKPARMQVNADNIPAELKALRRWVCWKWDWKADADGGRGKWTKVPINARTGRNAKSTDAKTWADFATALAAMEAGRGDGVGIVLGSLADGRTLCGVDLDGCRNPATGELTPIAQAVIELLSSYAEVSPTGTGVKVICLGSLPPGRRASECGGYECYESGRYFTITGQIVDGATRALHDATAELAQFHESLIEPQRGGQSHGDNAGLTDRERAVAALSALKPFRADNRLDWIQVGMALKSVDDLLLPEWVAWSQQSAKFAGEADCAKTWASFKRNGVGIGSLIHWAKADGGTVPRAATAARSVPAASASTSTLREKLIAEIGDPTLLDWCDMELTELKGDKSRWLLFSQQFSKAEKSCLEFESTERLQLTREFRKLAYEKAKRGIPDKILKNWKAICDLLVEHSGTVALDFDERRDVQIVRVILMLLDRAKPTPIDEPDANGDPTRLSDGSVWFTVGAFCERIWANLNSLKVESTEIARYLNKIGKAERRTKRVNGRVLTRKVVTPAGQQALRDFVGEGP